MEHGGTNQHQASNESKQVGQRATYAHAGQSTCYFKNGVLPVRVDTLALKASHLLRCRQPKGL
jgi:hypothetical protein